MARNNLLRILPSISDISVPKLTESLTCSAHNSATRLLCSATHQSPPHHDQNPSNEQEGIVKSNLQTQNPTDQKEEEEDDDDDDGGVNVNKVTGEIGGPKGPEPTRYGDWERGGRCSDF